MINNRRKFLKYSGQTLGLGLLSSSSLLNTGCALKPHSRHSYIHDIVAPNNMNAVFYWTDIMLQTVRDQSINPPKATRIFAMGHVAGFLAANGLDKKYNNSFKLDAEAPKDIDPAIAYGVACSGAIADAFQSSFYLNRRKFLDQFPNSDKKLRSIKWGEYVAKAITRARAQDGAEPSKSNFYLGRYDRRGDILEWSPTAPFFEAEDGPSFNSFNRGLLPGWGKQKPWIMRDTVRFRAKPFPDVKSPEFAQMYKKIKDLGGKDSKIRTEDQTQIAFFWEDGPRGVTPPGHWQLIAMDLVQKFNYDFVDIARIFALMSVGQADAGITTWDSKFYYDIVRPETAIRKRTHRFNNPHLTEGPDSNWESLIPTPPFPAYTSGHSTFSAVSAKILALAIGRDKITFSGNSPDLVNWPAQLTGVRRTWKSLSGAAKEASSSREYGGIHWEADAVEGLNVGYNLGTYVFNHAFQRRV